MLETEPSGIIEEISPEDGMYNFSRNRGIDYFKFDQETAESRARAFYFQAAHSALECIELALLAARKDDVRRVLDFGCGHGRVLRMLKAVFPDAQLTACDIDRGGVDFCAETFGAVPVYSDTDPDEIEIQGDFDLIWCGSVFTHLDRPGWDGLLSLFESLLSPGGVLVLTTSGREVAEGLHAGKIEYSRLSKAEIDRLVDDFERTGFGYRDLPNLNDYGTSLASPSWVCAWLTRQSRLGLVLFTERGWATHQDVVACIRPEDS